MKEWWLSRQTRERQLLIGGGSILVAVLLYVLAWEPWQQRLERLRTDVSALQADLVWMRQVAAELHQRQVTAPPPSAGIGGMALATRIEQSARSAGLETGLRRLEPQTDGSLRLWLEQTSFSRLLPWLVELHNGGDIRIDEVHLERPATVLGDRVNARLTLRSG